MKGCFLFTNSVLSICPPTSSSLFFLFLPRARNVIHSSSIPLSSPSPLLSLTLFALISIRHLLSPCSSWLLCTAHALRATVDPLKFLVWENQGAEQGHCVDSERSTHGKGFTFWVMWLIQGEEQLLRSGPWGSQIPSGARHRKVATPVIGKSLCSVLLVAFCPQHPELA